MRRKLLTAGLLLAPAMGATVLAQSKRPTEDGKLPIILTIQEIRFFRDVRGDAAIAVTIAIKARETGILLNTFHNDCSYDISFNSQGFQWLSSPVALGRAAEERDWVQLDVERARVLEIAGPSTGHMKVPKDGLRTVTVRLKGTIKNGARTQNAIALSKPFNLLRRSSQQGAPADADKPLR